MFRRWPFRKDGPKETQAGNAALEAGRRQGPGMFVRLVGGKRVKITGAEYVVVKEGGGVVFLDENRQVLSQFPWVEVIAYGREK